MNLGILLTAVAGLSVLTGWTAENAAPARLLDFPFLERLLAENMSTHPSLRAAEDRVNAAEENLAAVRSWEDPVLTLGGTAAQRRMRAEDGDIALALEQKLPLYGRPRLARRIAQADIAIEQVALEDRQRSLRRDVWKALNKVALAERELAISRTDAEWIELTVSAAEKRYATGAGGQIELIRLQIERAQRRSDIQTLTNNLGREVLSLNRLLNLPSELAWPALLLPELTPVLTLDPKLFRLASEAHSQARLLEHEAEKAIATTQLTRAARWPGFAVGAGAQQFSGSGEVRQGFVSLSFNLPWFNHHGYQSDLAREVAHQQSLHNELIAQHRMVEDEVSRAVVTMNAARQRALLAQTEVQPALEQALKTARTGWENNRTSFLELLELRRVSLETQTTLARATVEQQEALADLLYLVGTPDVAKLQARLENR